MPISVTLAHPTGARPFVALVTFCGEQVPQGDHTVSAGSRKGPQVHFVSERSQCPSVAATNWPMLVPHVCDPPTMVRSLTLTPARHPE